MVCPYDQERMKLGCDQKLCLNICATYITSLAAIVTYYYLYYFYYLIII